MTIHLYDADTLTYLGDFTSPVNKNQLDEGTLIWFNKQKYRVVDSENVTPANIKNELLNNHNRANNGIGQAMKHMIFSLTVRKV